MARAWWRAVSAAGLTLALGGCLPKGAVPMNTLVYPPQSSPSGSLVVFLRGLGGSHASFEEHGFVQAVAARFPGAAMVAPDANLLYYLDRSLDRRLKEDVLDPAFDSGTRRVWLIGVSMGGLGGVLTSRRYPGEIQGIALISPFLGYSSIHREIERAGGLHRWDPGPYTEDDWERVVWDWLRTRTAEQRPQAFPIYLGYGQGDDYAAAQRLLAAALPPGHVVTVDGGHTVDTFVRLFDALLPALPLEGPGTALGTGLTHAHSPGPSAPARHVEDR